MIHITVGEEATISQRKTILERLSKSQLNTTSAPVEMVCHFPAAVLYTFNGFHTLNSHLGHKGSWLFLLFW
jgi:hypothetical protein